MFAQLVLNRRLNSEGGESMSPTHVGLMPIGPKRQAVKADGSEVVPKPPLVVENMFDDHSGIDDVGRIGVLAAIAARQVVGVEDTCADQVQGSRGLRPRQLRAQGR